MRSSYPTDAPARLAIDDRGLACLMLEALTAPPAIACLTAVYPPHPACPDPYSN